MADSTNAQIGVTATLSYWNTAASPDAWAELGQIRQITGIGVTKAEVDSTTLDSDAVEYIGGLASGDQVSITLTSGSANGNLDLITGWVDGTTEIDFKIALAAPATETRYFSLTPLHYDFGTIAPSGLIEPVFSGRITGGISATPSHA